MHRGNTDAQKAYILKQIEAGPQAGPTVAQALAVLMPNSEALRPDQPPPKWWSFKFSGFDIYCYNFGWRQQAILGHDLHHLLTGYPLTMVGEMQVAAWEFAAGRFPSIFATLFCLPLVAIGAVAWPKRTFSAFVRGRHSTSLYKAPVNAELLKMQLSDLQKTSMPKWDGNPNSGDILAYALLVCQALVLVVAPFAIGAYLASI